MTEYRVDLDAYNGPLDLLLFLIRREEVDIYDIPISRITAQYVAYVELLKELDPESIGDFLVLAASLMEIKSRTLLPKPPPLEEGDDLTDPRLELVRQLLAYKRFKDAARTLGDAAVEQAMRHPRKPTTPPQNPEEIELDNLEIWDLFDAFNRLMEQTGRKQAVHEVSIDDTPLALHAEDITDSLEHGGGLLEFTEVFSGRTRGEMIGLFLALLELIRTRRVRATQVNPNGPITLQLVAEDSETVAEYEERAEDGVDELTADVAELTANVDGASAENSSAPSTSFEPDQNAHHQPEQSHDP